MTEIESVRDQVRAIARSILRGEVSEWQGAAEIWVLLAEAGYPDDLHEARVAFVGAASEWEDYPERGEAYAADIRESAKEFAR